MSGMVRDFSLKSVEHLREIIKKNVDEDGEFFLVDWVKDWFIDDLNIEDYINDIDTYHAKMVDKYDISTKKFDQILNKVHAVDVSYADRFSAVNEGLGSFNALIMNVTALIDPSAVTLDSGAYDELLSGIENIHKENMEKIEEHIENDDAELDEALREVPWYETALDFVAGAGVEFGKNTLEGFALIPFGIIDGVFGTTLNNDLSSGLDYLEETYIIPHIGNKEAYYYGRAAGDVISIVAGAIGMAKGVITILGGITITAGGTVLSATGVGAIAGAPAIAISVPVVLAGTAEMAVAGGVCFEGFNNINDNIRKASTDKVSEVSSSKEANIQKELKSNSFKDKINNIDDNILSDMEARGGHTIDRHVGKDEQYLLNRVKGMKSKNAAATSFNDSETAAKALKDTLTKNSDDIENWLNNSSDARKTIETNFNYDVGYGIPKSTGLMETGIRKTITVIVRDPTSPLGFYVLTTYPSLK